MANEECGIYSIFETMSGYSRSETMYGMAGVDYILNWSQTDKIAVEARDRKRREKTERAALKEQMREKNNVRGAYIRLVTIGSIS